eukprot:NODE_8432_length_383_cov_339.506098.p2 GENE.NODE_8432_length_383_cov_339.506098~~NODE_8432_length_383_cov_339.506098.p2  ORF type:complete len:83 (-),score=30.08 NODE_8432_length_383_cov_339.506098:117-365(-)
MGQLGILFRFIALICLLLVVFSYQVGLQTQKALAAFGPWRVFSEAFGVLLVSFIVLVVLAEIELMGLNGITWGALLERVLGT